MARVHYRVWNPLTGDYVLGLYAQLRYLRGETIQKILHVDHLSAALEPGTRVSAGAPWAWTGNSGISTGPHAHLEDRHGPVTDHWSLSWDWYRWNPERSLEAKP